MTPDSSMVICPNCVHQFRAIPEDVQAEIVALRERVQEQQTMLLDANDALRSCFAVAERCAVAEMPGTNWNALHDRLDKILSVQHKAVAPYYQQLCDAQNEAALASKRVAELEGSVRFKDEVLKMHEHRCKELEAERDAFRQDAKRYRWLRQQHWDESEIACVMYPKDAIKLGQDCPSLERLDAAIDAARSGKEST